MTNKHHITKAAGRAALSGGVALAALGLAAGTAVAGPNPGRDIKDARGSHVDVSPPEAGGLGFRDLEPDGQVGSAMALGLDILHGAPSPQDILHGAPSLQDILHGALKGFGSPDPHPPTRQ